jgi:hypothetical protein
VACPVVIAVDDDPDVLKSIERDLRWRYADRYRVLSANSGAAGLAISEKSKRRAGDALVGALLRGRHGVRRRRTARICQARCVERWRRLDRSKICASLP